MANPFGDPEGAFRVLVNDEGQHSLWPTPLAVPNGWTVVKESDTHASCLAYIEEHWTDVRPISVRAQPSQHSLILGT
jgi:MbtH protein